MIVQTTYNDVVGLVFGKIHKEVKVDNFLLGYKIFVKNDYMICSVKHIKKIKGI